MDGEPCRSHFICPLLFQDHKLKELIQKQAEIQPPLHSPTPMEDEDAPDSRLSGDEDNDGESDDNFSSYEEEFEKGLGQEEVKYIFYFSQFYLCCGSGSCRAASFSTVLRIRDVYPGSEFCSSRIRIKELKYFFTKKWISKL
jgi:hypothetical protein